MTTQTNDAASTTIHERIGETLQDDAAYRTGHAGTEMKTWADLSGRSICIIVSGSKKFYSNHYLLHRLMEAWAETGLKLTVANGRDPLPQADLALLHSDLTVVPEAFVNSIQQFAGVVINGGTRDISKRRISTNVLARPEEDGGAVLLKTNRNDGGFPELTEFASHSLTNRCLAALAERLPWRLTGLMKSKSYPLFEDAKKVPRLVWRDPRFVVERFKPERNGDLYRLRNYYFFGSKEIGISLYSKSPVVKGANSFEWEQDHNIPDEILKIRKSLGFDYGRFDYGIIDGEVVLYDANRTPAASPTSVLGPRRRIIDTLARGILDYIKEPEVRYERIRA